MRLLELYTVLALGCFVLFGCNPREKTHEVPLFLYTDLQDSIREYVKSTPAIENPLNLPTFTQVIFDYIEGDTLVIARPALDPYPSFRDSVIGANYLEGRICEIIYGVYGSFKHLPGIVNEKVLTVSRKDYDARANLPTDVKDGEKAYFDLLKKGTMDRVWVLNRPNPLKLIVIDGKSP